MNNWTKQLLMIMSLCAFNFIMHAELLVVKRGGEGFVQLDEKDEVNKDAIANVFLKYEWPMVIANTALTKQEQDELLTADKPYAEEEFIRNKLKQIDERYDVVFIPTSIYEIGIIGLMGDFGNKFYKSRGRMEEINESYVPQDPLENAVQNFIRTKYYISLADILVTGDSINVAYKKIYAVYTRANAFFYPEAFFYVNNALIAKLFDAYPTLKSNHNGQAVSVDLESKASQIYTVLESVGFKPNATILSQVLSIEYEARKKNKGLLLRGAPERFLSVVGEGESPIAVMDTMIQEKYFFTDVAKAYKEQRNKRYSVSFGNSLFAGWFEDKLGCVYDYLSRRPGYALLIDKKAYVRTHNNDLFLIAPLAPIVAIFSAGQWFHSRTKLAAGMGEVMGMKAGSKHFVIDRTGIFEIERDPLIHAQLFSAYLAKNMRIIWGSAKEIPSNFSAEEKAIYAERQEQELKKNQEQAAKSYASIRKLAAFFAKASPVIKQKFLERHKQEFARKEQEDAQKNENIAFLRNFVTGKEDPERAFVAAMDVIKLFTKNDSVLIPLIYSAAHVLQGAGRQDNARKIIDAFDNMIYGMAMQLSSGNEGKVFFDAILKNLRDAGKASKAQELIDESQKREDEMFEEMSSQFLPSGPLTLDSPEPFKIH